MLFGPDAAADLYRGFYVSETDLERLWAQPPAAPHFSSNGASDQRVTAGAVPADSRLHWLQTTYQLTAFDLDLLLLALAPELDRRYERLYAYLQDHVSRRWPTVDLALHLLCGDAVERLERRCHFDPDAPLIQAGLVHLLAEQEGATASLLSHTIRLDEQVVRFLLHQDALDVRIAPFCQLAIASPLPRTVLAEASIAQTFNLVEHAWQAKQPLRLYFQGVEGVGKREVAGALATTVGAPLLVVNLARLVGSNTAVTHALSLIFRYARFYSVLLYLDGLHHLTATAQQAAYGPLLDLLTTYPGVVIVAGRERWAGLEGSPLGVLTVTFPMPSFAARRAWWQAHLARLGCHLPDGDLDALADRFRLTPTLIAEATAVACNLARQRAAVPTDGLIVPTLADLFCAARTQCGHALAVLARKVAPTYQWADIVLPDDALHQLQEFCRRVALRHQVWEAWGFADKVSAGKGVNALFAGPSGAGKTMAAEIMANELGLDLYKIDLSGVVSKYIGETEKNLDRIFVAAENANAILFFDEADALFGKRSEVSDAHDRYANIEISYLLQKMEEFDGVTILATNLRQNLDDAFIRRMAFVVHFPFPDSDSRRQIWEGIWPNEAPLAEDVDLPLLAERFKLSGGNIKNVALAAAFLAASEGSPIKMAHLYGAIRREYQKMGKVLAEVDGIG
ncbi:MAG: ATP-binding protein [Caldilineaceae bacterium]